MASVSMFDDVQLEAFSHRLYGELMAAGATRFPPKIRGWPDVFKALQFAASVGDTLREVRSALDMSYFKQQL